MTTERGDMLCSSRRIRLSAAYFRHKPTAEVFRSTTEAIDAMMFKYTESKFVRDIGRVAASVDRSLSHEYFPASSEVTLTRLRGHFRING